MSAEPGWPVGGFAGIGDEAAPDLAGQVAAVVGLGWTGLELRTVNRVPVAALSPVAFGRVAETVLGAGLRVVCLDSHIGCRSIGGSFADDLVELDVLATRAAALGCRYLRIMSWPNDGLPAAEWRRRVLERVRRLADRAAAA